eukprot:352826-Chlamydomonas_euryale.AAC.4
MCKDAGCKGPCQGRPRPRRTRRQHSMTVSIRVGCGSRWPSPSPAVPCRLRLRRRAKTCSRPAGGTAPHAAWHPASPARARTCRLAGTRRVGRLGSGVTQWRERGSVVRPGSHPPGFQ